jgi:hypothetical protein
LLYLLPEVCECWDRLGWRLLEEAAQGWMSSERHPESVQVVALSFDRLLRFLDWCSVGANFTDRDTQSVGQGLEDGQALDGLNTAFDLGDPAFRPSHCRSKVALRHTGSAPELLDALADCACV